MIVREIFRVLIAASWVERMRQSMGPKAALTVVRRMGATKTKRSRADRARLGRAVRLVDRLFPTGANCYRRALLEAALDAGAAAEPLMMGFRTDGAEGRTGHAWLGSDPSAQPYDVVVSA